MRDLLWDPTAGVEEDKDVGALNTVESPPVCFDTVLDTDDSDSATPSTKQQLTWIKHRLIITQKKI